MLCAHIGAMLGLDTDTLVSLLRNMWIRYQDAPGVMSRNGHVQRR